MSLTGRWRIVEMDMWDRKDIDLMERGFIEFGQDGTGQFGFIAVRGWMDCRHGERDGHACVEFTWEGEDEGDQVSGRGWAGLTDDGSLGGHLFFHLGDDSGFRAVRAAQERTSTSAARGVGERDVSRRVIDRLEREIEAALDPGRFVSDGACFGFVGDLEEAEAAVATLVEAAPARAIALHEAFRIGCHEKADEVDDSSDSFAMFLTTLVCGWIKARQAVGVAPDETATRLLACMDDDPFALCYRLENDAAAVLDKAGLAAFTNR